MNFRVQDSRENELSDMIVNYYETHANTNGIVGTSQRSQFTAWLKELDGS